MALQVMAWIGSFAGLRGLPCDSSNIPKPTAIPCSFWHGAICNHGRDFDYFCYRLQWGWTCLASSVAQSFWGCGAELEQTWEHKLLTFPLNMPSVILKKIVFQLNWLIINVCAPHGGTFPDLLDSNHKYMQILYMQILQNIKYPFPSWKAEGSSRDRPLLRSSFLFGFQGVSFQVTWGSKCASLKFRNLWVLRSVSPQARPSSALSKKSREKEVLLNQMQAPATASPAMNRLCNRFCQGLCWKIHHKSLDVVTKKKDILNYSDIPVYSPHFRVCALQSNRFCFFWPVRLPNAQANVRCLRLVWNSMAIALPYDLAMPSASARPSRCANTPGHCGSEVSWAPSSWCQHHSMWCLWPLVSSALWVEFEETKLCLLTGKATFTLWHYLNKMLIIDKNLERWQDLP